MPRLASLTFTFFLLLGCSSRPVPAPVVEVFQGKTFREVKQNSYTLKQYEVAKGDTLYSIAWQAGKDFQELARLNKINKPYDIYPGQILTLVKNIDTKSIKRKKSDRTSNIKTETSVDPKKKQEYGANKGASSGKTANLERQHNSRKVQRWIWPAKGKLVGTYSLKEQGNKGIDISGAKGTKIVASAEGKVVYTGSALRGFGNLVIIKHNDNLLSAYAHNHKIFVKEQEWVKAGQTIASMGDSGTDTTKLHFEIRLKGKSIDPLRYLAKKQQ